MTDRLPLPEPNGWAGKDYYHRPATTPLADINKFAPEQARYTADQMHAYYDAAYRAGLEAAALVCDEVAVDATLTVQGKAFYEGMYGGAINCAGGIRALEISHD